MGIEPAVGYIQVIEQLPNKSIIFTIYFLNSKIEEDLEHWIFSLVKLLNYSNIHKSLLEILCEEFHFFKEVFNGIRVEVDKYLQQGDRRHFVNDLAAKIGNS